MAALYSDVLAVLESARDWEYYEIVLFSLTCPPVDMSDVAARVFAFW